MCYYVYEKVMQIFHYPFLRKSYLLILNMVQLKRFSLAAFLCLLFGVAAAQNFGGNAPSVKWKQINTPASRIIFPVGLDSQASRMVTLMHLLDSTTTATIGGQQRKWNIILQNQTTVPNAYVRMAPIMSELYMTPGQDNFSLGSLRWDDNLLIHENRHIQQFSNFNKGITKVFSFFLGQEGQLFANGLLIPDYFFEGDAVFQETLVSKQGRGRMPSFFNGFKSIWEADKKYSWWKYRSGSLKDYVPDHYQLGYLMVAYGYEKYGNDFWKNVTTDAVRGKHFFNKGIKKYAGVSFKEFRTDAITFFKEKSVEKNIEPLQYITGTAKNNVISYHTPHFIGNDTVITIKESLKEASAFYIIANGKEEKLRTQNIVLDNYFSCNNNTIVYAAYASDPRWGNRDYSVLHLLDIKSKKQKQLTFKSKYFSPNINAAGTQVLAVKVNTNGTNNLVLLNSATGKETKNLANGSNYFFTYPKFLNESHAVATARNPEGNMALVKINLESGQTELLTFFSYNVIGYPMVKGDTVFFSKMNSNADKIFAYVLNDKKTYRITNNSNGIYAPAVNNKAEMLYSAFTVKGYRLVKKTGINNTAWARVTMDEFIAAPDLYVTKALSQKGAGLLNNSIAPEKHTVTQYKKTAGFFNFHSRRPIATDVEMGYSFFSDNVLSSFSNIIKYTYNRTDRSHTAGFNSVFAGWLPLLNAGVEQSFNRTIDTAVGKPFQFNSAAVKAGISIPLSFVGGRTAKYLNFGAGYNVEQYYYKGVGKNIFKNKAINYVNTFFSFSNVNRKALQHINPRWAQALSFSYRDAFTFRNSHKFVSSLALYFPGLAINHSLVVNAAYQKRDTLPDLFSNNFSYSRGYEALSTRKMYKLGFNYHFPLLYPDGGINGLIYFQRIRANTFYDYNNATARVNGILTNVINRSTGAEVYFDTKVWNSLPVSFGIRFTRLLDIDLRNPGIKNRWEFILPVNLIPE